MTENLSSTNQRGFWKAYRDRYRIDAACRNPFTGKLGFPVPRTNANCWVIVRESRGDEDPYELPTPKVVAECDDEQTADMLVQLIKSTTSLGGSR